MNPTLTQTAPRQHADAAQIPADPLRAFIVTCVRRKQTPLQIIDAVKATIGIEIDYGQVILCWKGEITIPTQTAHRQRADEIALPTQTARRQDADEIACTTQTARRQHADKIAFPTQTEHRPDKESVQIPADEAQEPLFTHMPEFEASAQTLFSILPDPGPISAVSDAGDAPTTQTGRRQDAESLPDADDPPATQTERRQDAESLPDASDGPATQTGRRQDQKTKPVLTDEVKAFIVRGLARYGTPTRVAASVQAQFGIAIDRRQVYAYDPAGSRPPAQRWIDLHAATRAKFLEAAAGRARPRSTLISEERALHPRRSHAKKTTCD
jgi:hypothetical protein